MMWNCVSGAAKRKRQNELKLREQKFMVKVPKLSQFFACDSKVVVAELLDDGTTVSCEQPPVQTMVSENNQLLTSEILPAGRAKLGDHEKGT